MDKFNNQFATQKLRQEMSVTGTGATFTPGTGEQMASNKAFKKKTKKEVKDVEPKYAAGKAKIYPKEKWGWKDAPSIPNRPSKGGFIYKQLFEELSNFIKEAEGRIHIGTDTKTDSDIYFEPKTGAFYINIIDPAGNRTNKLQVNTIEDVLAKFPSWKWTEAGKAEFSDNLDEIDRNDPILMALRAKKDAPKPQAPQAKKANPNQAKINMLLKKRAEIERDMEQEAEPEGGPIADKYGDMLNKIDQAVRKLKGQGEWGPETNPYMDKGEIERRAAMMEDEPEEQDDDEDRYDWFTDKYEPASDYGRYRQDPEAYEKDYQERGTSDYFQRRSLDENYSKFKNETKTRGKSDQFHQAVRQVKKKVQEINRLFEYVSRLKMELSEGEDGLKYKMHTEKALEKIKEMVSALNKNIRKFK